MSAGYDRDEWSPQGPVVELSESHSWDLLRLSSFGRLAVSVDNRPQIFPVDFHCAGESILFRTAEGSKLRDLLLNDSVAFETDHRGRDESWSVVVDGVATVLTADDDIAEADRAPFPPWVPTAPYVFVRITPTSIRARRFTHSLLASRDDRSSPA